MSTINEPENTCKTCGATIPDGAPGGLCPACVLVGSQSEAPAAGAPSVAQIAAAFPELEIVNLVGRGGMGAVYHARQEKLDRDIALKILLPDLGGDPAFAERFSREARALAKLNHPNIVAVYDFGERDGLFYLMMEFVDGVNLRQAMAAGQFTPEQALAVVPGVCDALQSAHAQEILHRDIKPENILLDKDGKVKIVDFGIARLVGDTASDYTLTEAGAMLGSRQYMAPEQLERTHLVDHRADIYSLGVVLYEMLTGELPIGRFLPPSEKSATTEDIDAVVMRALEKELDRRFQNVEDVKTEVGGASLSKPVPPPPVSANQIEMEGISKIAQLGLVVVVLGLVLPVLFVFGLASGSSSLVGLLLLPFGYSICWLALRAMRRREVSQVGRGWVLFVVIGLPQLVVAGYASLLFGEVFGDYGKKGMIFMTMMCVAAVTYLVGVGVVRWSGFQFSDPRARAWMWRLVAVLMASAGIFAGLKEGRWPYAHSKVTGWVHLPTNGVQPGDLEAAADWNWGKYDLEWEDKYRLLAVTVLHEGRSGNEAAGHIEAFGQRLIRLQSPEQQKLARVEVFHRVSNSPSLRLAGFAMLAGAAAAGLALLGLPGGVVGILAMLVSYGLMIFSPARPYPLNGPQLVKGPSLPFDGVAEQAEKAEKAAELFLAVTRFDALNTALAAYVQSRGRSNAASEWKGAENEVRRYQLLTPFLAFSPKEKGDYLPEGFEFLLPEELPGRLVLIGRNGERMK